MVKSLGYCIKEIVAFPVPRTRGVVYWSSPGSTTVKYTAGAARLMRLLELEFTTLAVKIKKNVRLSKFKETKKLRIQRRKKRKEKYKEYYKRDLRLILAPG